MIIFKTLRYKNFLSSGNTFTEIQLDRNKSTLVVGQNGAGKSTMLDALSFALFGKAHRSINKMQLINSINNKGCLVEIDFSIGGNQFKVNRGIKPNVFEIWKNGTMINQSSHSKEYQKILEQNILKLNHKSFHQVVVLGSSSFIPFMQLPSHIRREVIEDLLDINVFSKMNVILKEKNVQLKDKLRQIDYNIDIVKTKIESQKKYIRDIAALTEENRKDYESRIHASQNNIDELQAENSELGLGLDESISEADERLRSLQSRKQDLLLRSQDRQTNIRDLEKRITFFDENESCPVCDQAISDSHKSEILRTTEESQNRGKSALKEIGVEGLALEENAHNGFRKGCQPGAEAKRGSEAEDENPLGLVHQQGPFRLLREACEDGDGGNEDGAREDSQWRHDEQVGIAHTRGSPWNEGGKKHVRVSR